EWQSTDLQEHINFFESLAILKKTNAKALQTLLESPEPLASVQLKLRNLLHHTFLNQFDLPNDNQSIARLLALSNEWGSMNPAVQLMARLRESPGYEEHVALLKK